MRNDAGRKVMSVILLSFLCQNLNSLLHNRELLLRPPGFPPTIQIPNREFPPSIQIVWLENIAVWSNIMMVVAGKRASELFADFLNTFHLPAYLQYH